MFLLNYFLAFKKLFNYYCINIYFEIDHSFKHNSIYQIKFNTYVFIQMFKYINQIFNIYKYYVPFIFNINSKLLDLNEISYFSKVVN